MTSPISFIGSAVGTNSATVPANQAGDIAVAFSFRDDGTANAPTLPSGWTSIASGTNNSIAARSQYKILDGTTPSVTFTNASAVVIHVYRASGYTLSIGDFNQKGAASGNVIFNALTAMAHTDGSSWALGFVGHQSTDTSIETPPTGMTNRSDTVPAGVCEVAGHDTNGGVSSWAQQTVTQGGTSGAYRDISIELMATQVIVALTGDGSSQASTSGTGAATQSQVLSGDACAQASTSASGAIAQGQVLSAAACGQTAGSSAAAVVQAQVLSGSDSAQGAASGVGAMAQGHILSGLGASQGGTSAAGAILQGQILVGAACAQAGSSGTGGIVVAQQVSYDGLPDSQRWVPRARGRAFVPAARGRDFVPAARGRAWRAT